jgi:hypothetical protein
MFACFSTLPAGIDPLMVQLIQSRVNAALLKDCGAAAALAGTSEAGMETVAAVAQGQQ